MVFHVAAVGIRTAEVVLPGLLTRFGRHIKYRVVEVRACLIDPMKLRLVVAPAAARGRLPRGGRKGGTQGGWRNSAGNSTRNPQVRYFHRAITWDEDLAARLPPAVHRLQVPPNEGSGPVRAFRTSLTLPNPTT